MISHTHLKSHGISSAEYKAKFPGSRLRIQTTASKEKMSASKHGAIPWNKGISTGPNQKISDAKRGQPNIKLQGRTLSAQTRQKIAVSVREAMPQAMNTAVRQKIKDATLRRKQDNTFIAPMLGKRHSDETKQKIREAVIQTWRHKSDQIISAFVQTAEEQGLCVKQVEDNYWFHLRCLTCATDFTFSRQVFRDSTRAGSSLCPACHPRTTGRSKAEKEFFDCVKSLAPDAVANDRGILGGKEIDVLIPRLGVGFEFTGLYWHAEGQNPEKNHLLWKQQFALKRGVQLYTVFEDEWTNKREIVLSRISSILGVSLRKIYARSCKVEIINSREGRQFLDVCHLQGKDTASLGLGLRKDGELVALATFKKTNMVKGGNGDRWELSRFCTSLNTTVVGAASRLIQHFMKDHNPNRLDLISYADARWSTGALYQGIGFKFDSRTAPSYWYLSNSYSKRVHRSTYMKHKLVRTPGDEKLTEWELARRAGLDRIWDCGTTKWVLEHPNK